MIGCALSRLQVLSFPREGSSFASAYFCDHLNNGVTVTSDTYGASSLAGRMGCKMLRESFITILTAAAVAVLFAAKICRLALSRKTPITLSPFYIRAAFVAQQ